ncbi:tribbles homolog 1 [Sardina pilchardus]|uniref:tribbles homolog 1 n=1 Tax=Sardina pilchardus TaxID=27697 RepID=UPI002E0FC9A7
MSVQLNVPVPCIRTGRSWHKRVDTDEPVAKCARLSESSSDAGLLGSSPGSPVNLGPLTGTATHQGPSRICQFLLLPLADRSGVHSALNIETGEELVCKVFDMGIYQEKVRAYDLLPAHGNIAGIREVILGERKAYVFQEKDYGDMHTYVKSCRRLAEEQAARLFQQVASAVAHCHQAGIVLGDLKLRKFVFTDEKRTRVKLEGLEDCRILPGDDDLVSDTHGCPAYVSPEILSGGVGVRGGGGGGGGGGGCYSGRAADAWSLGVVLYTMLAGRYPFHDPDPAALFSRIRRGQYCLPEGLSAKARCLLRSLLRRDPAERLTAAEVLIHPWLSRGGRDEDAARGGEQEVSPTDQAVPSTDSEPEDSNLFL